MSRRALIGFVTCFVVAFGIPWTGWIFVGDERLSLWLFPLFASFAGFAAAFAEDGKAGLKAFSQRVFKTAGALRYVLAALVVPLSLGLGYTACHRRTIVKYALVTRRYIGALAWCRTGDRTARRGGSAGAEYLQHRLGGHLAPFWTAGIVGVIWWLWHFALYRESVFAEPMAALNRMLYLVTWSVLMVYLVERAGGSVWPAVALHWAANTHPGVLQALLPSIDGSVLPGARRGHCSTLRLRACSRYSTGGFYFSKRARNVCFNCSLSLRQASLSRYRRPGVAHRMSHIGCRTPFGRSAVGAV
ncbi:MAG: CPBP family intramembrane glutamic endopeptidase [Rheinheimera sp.]|nr:CPBP family intramembrane glutamic endopeptidase [Rheinheimera sp.]